MSDGLRYRRRACAQQPERARRVGRAGATNGLVATAPAPQPAHGRAARRSRQRAASAGRTGNGHGTAPRRGARDGVTACTLRCRMPAPRRTAVPQARSRNRRAWRAAIRSGARRAQRPAPARRRTELRSAAAAALRAGSRTRPAASPTHGRPNRPPRKEGRRPLSIRSCAPGSMATLPPFSPPSTRPWPATRRRAESALREATDRLLRAGARTRIELERLEARVPLTAARPDGGRRGRLGGHR